MTAQRLPATAAPAVVDVLADAFASYPVMTFVLGPGGNTSSRLAELIGLFVKRRAMMGGPMFGVNDSGGRLAGAVVMTLPRETEPTDEVFRLRNETWQSLGEDCRVRYDAYGAAAKTVSVPEAHHHLNMIGVRQASHGLGYARPLLESAFQLVLDDPDSAGLSLTTELPRNVELYRHFGFNVVGEAHVTPGMTTWGMFKARA